MPVWPSSLPAYPLLGNKGQFPNLTLSTAMDVGPSKVRRRAVAASTPRECSWVLSGTQLAALRTFFMADLAGGALSFDMVNPVTDQVTRWRFKPGTPPTDEQIGPDVYSVAATLEELP